MSLKTTLLSLSLLLGFFTHGSNPVEIASDEYGLVRAGHIQYFIDSSYHADPEGLDLNNFEVSNQDVVALDFVNYPLWFYFSLSPQDGDNGVFINVNNPLIDTLEFFVRRNGGPWQLEAVTGMNFDFESRPVTHQNFVFRVKLSPGEKVECMFKTRYTVPPQFPVKIYSETAVIDRLGSWDYFKGLFYGIMLVMFLYNLFVSIATKDTAYYYYVAYVLFIALTQTVLDGSLEMYFVDLPPGLMRFVLIAFPALSGIAALQFAKIFLHLKDIGSRWFHVMTACQVLYGIAILLSILGMSQMAYRSIDLGGGVAALIGFSASIYLSVKGYRAAKIFLGAWSFFMASIIIYVLRTYGIMPYNPFTENILLVGIASEVILLSIALADRINTLRRERQESQEEALRVSLENERIIRDQNITLEKKVSERTLELEEANEELSVTLSNLRETQTQLVDAEKMASLGQLTAGIAHEINNPINFVSSNIQPLSRDLEEVYQIIDAYKDADGDDALDKLKQAHELREELDYDFIRDEIQDLVKGISDGAARTSEIVQGLRSFSRLDEDAVKMADVSEGIASTLVLLRTKLNGNVSVIEEYEPDLQEIECYPGKLNQVFMNILNNSIYAVEHKKYQEPERPEIKISTVKRGDEVEVRFSDNGIGMDEETKKKVFDPFFTTKDVGEGTGLGMSIVYKIIDKHGGRIDVKSEVGIGTDFVITLPMRQPKSIE